MSWCSQSLMGIRASEVLFTPQLEYSGSAKLCRPWPMPAHSKLAEGIRMMGTHTALILVSKLNLTGFGL